MTLQLLEKSFRARPAFISTTGPPECDIKLFSLLRFRSKMLPAAAVWLWAAGNKSWAGLNFGRRGLPWKYSCCGRSERVSLQMNGKSCSSGGGDFGLNIALKHVQTQMMFQHSNPKWNEYESLHITLMVFAKNQWCCTEVNYPLKCCRLLVTLELMHHHT